MATRLLGDLYPASSQLRGEQGPVVLYFTLEKAKGRASHIEVMGSSLSTRLDEAAVQYLEGLTFTTPCPGTRYSMQIDFGLK